MLAEVAAMNHLFDELHRLCVSGSLKKAYDQLVSYMGEDIDQLDPIIYQRLIDFQDKRLTLQHGVHYLQRLADRGDKKKAWTVMKTCLRHDEQFRPLTAQTLLDLTRAAQQDDAAFVNEVLSNFAEAYPDSELISHARFRQARVASELLGDAHCGRELLLENSKSDPEFARSDEFQSYAKRLNLS
jgi:hypothetical protein